MEDSPKLLSMPQEVLSYIGSFLSPSDLLAMSATCHHLRAAFNDNWIWRKFSSGGQVSSVLDRTPCLVKPEFTNSQVRTLEPLCPHRVHFSKQSRLLNNLRQGKFVQYNIQFDGYLSDFESQKPLKSRQITYDSVYLFTSDYESPQSNDEVIKVFNIERDPYLITSFKLENHDPGYAVVIWFQVVENKFVVCKDDWIDVYEIKLPSETFPLLHTIKMNESGRSVLNNSIILGNFLLVENYSLNTMHLWNVHNGEKLEDIHPKIDGPEFSVLEYSEDNKYVLFSVGIPAGATSIPHVFVYDMVARKFTTFCSIVNENISKTENHGLVNESYVVILSYKTSSKCSILVFDHITSTLVVQNTNASGYNLERANIINDCLVLPSLVSVQIMDVKTLEILWELEYESGNLIHEIPQNFLVADVEYIHISSLCHIIVVHKRNGSEVWDFEKRIKLLDFPKLKSISVNDNYTKIIGQGEGSLSVWTFW